MINKWKQAKKVLCIRPDNMGDVIMTSPAIRAIKQSFGSKITLLTSPQANSITKFIPEIDDTISVSLPWVKTYDTPLDSRSYLDLIEKIKKQRFDAAVIFNVFSQNPWASIMTAYLAGIPLRLAYSHEKPYNLLTHWLPDPEPGSFIRHEAQRQIDLVQYVGAETDDLHYRLKYPEAAIKRLIIKLAGLGIDIRKRMIILHPGVSSEKRRYSSLGFSKAAKYLYRLTGYQIVFTGIKEERELAYEIQARSQIPSTNLAGILELDEFIALIESADLIISNNTSAVHIAAACDTPVVDLYALTNPQHTPWMVPAEVLYFKVPKHLAENLVSTQIPPKGKPLESPTTIVNSALKLLHFPRHHGFREFKDATPEQKILPG